MNRLVVFIALSYVCLCSPMSGQTQVINTVAGSGATGTFSHGNFSGDGGPATSALLDQPGSIFVDGSGNLFITDTGNARIREVAAGTGIITTVAGTGCCGDSGDGQLATSASLNQPQGVAVDASGNIYIADTGNNVVRKVAAGTGIITTIAGRVGQVGDYGDGGPASAALLWSPAGVGVDAAGNVYIADTVNNVIRKISVSNGTIGNISTVAGGAPVAACETDQGFGGDGGPATMAQLYLPTGVYVDSSGNLFIADRGNNRIRKVSTSGTITTVAGNGAEGSTGDGGPATAAELYEPTNVVVDASGDIFIAATKNNRIREVSAGGTITTVAGDGAMGFYGDGAAATNALLNQPQGVAVDASGDVFLADTGNNRIREVVTATAPPPAITSGGIVAVDSTVTTIQPGEFVSIYGTNLGPVSPATWTGVFVTSLGGTSVTVDGYPAYLTYAGPTQINLQAPNDSNTTNRSVNVAVTTAGGGTTTSTVTLAQFAPSFLLFPGMHVTGIIVRPDGSGSQGAGALSYDLLGPTGNSLGFPTVAAKPGDVVELYAVGLGPTNPPVPAGQPFPFSSSAQTTNQVSLSINNISVPPLSAGIDTSLLYQINVTIPAGLGTGDVPLVATVAGAQTQSGVVISLQ